MKKRLICLILCFFLTTTIFFSASVSAVNINSSEVIPDCVWSTFNDIIVAGEHGYYAKDAFVDSYATNFLVYSGSYNSYLFSFCESVYFDTSTNKTVQDKCNDVNGYNSFWVEIRSDGTYQNHSTGGYKSYYYYSTVGAVGNVWYPNLIYSTFDMNDQNGNLFIKGSGNHYHPLLEYPSIINSNIDLSSGNFDNIFVDLGSFDTVESVGLSVWQINDDYDVLLFKQDDTHSYPINGSRFLYQTNSNSFFYMLSTSFVGITYKNNIKYKIVVDNCEDFNSDNYKVYDEEIFTVGGKSQDDIHNQQQDILQGTLNKNTQDIINSNKETQNKLDEQTNAIKEQNETNKNIFQKIGDILSFINPFSENFFGRKLVELIIDGIKGLFVPEDGFFSEYFNEIKDWFSDRLGFLWSPFDFLIELLTKISNINFSEPKFSVPDIYEPFTNQKIISSTEFNFNDLLSNSILKTAHDIYLLLVDGFIIFSLYKLISAKIEEVFTK